MMHGNGIGVFKVFGTDISVRGNDAESRNTVSVTSEKETNVSHTNHTNITNDVNVDAETEITV